MTMSEDERRNAADKLRAELAAKGIDTPPFRNRETTEWERVPAWDLRLGDDMVFTSDPDPIHLNIRVRTVTDIIRYADVQLVDIICGRRRFIGVPTGFLIWRRLPENNSQPEAYISGIEDSITVVEQLQSERYPDDQYAGLGEAVDLLNELLKKAKGE